MPNTDKLITENAKLRAKQTKQVKPKEKGRNFQNLVTKHQASNCDNDNQEPNCFLLAEQNTDKKLFLTLVWPKWFLSRVFSTFCYLGHVIKTTLMSVSYSKTLQSYLCHCGQHLTLLLCLYFQLVFNLVLSDILYDLSPK